MECETTGVMRLPQDKNASADMSADKTISTPENKGSHNSTSLKQDSPCTLTDLKSPTRSTSRVPRRYQRSNAIDEYLSPSHALEVAARKMLGTSRSVVPCRRPLGEYERSLLVLRHSKKTAYGHKD